MSTSVRQQRIQRAETLRAEFPGSAEVLHFLVQVMHLQDELQAFLQKTLPNGNLSLSLNDPIAQEFAARFPWFLKKIESNGPATVADEARRLRNETSGCELIAAFWSSPATGASLIGLQEFLARAFLQPYAELIRSRSAKQLNEWTPRVCPFCLRKPGVGVLRPLGDGGQRFLVCSFCLGEWEFRRIICPACGEESEPKLPVYRADEFSHVRVECCDSCRTYLKTVDLTRNGLADPIVDEIAAIPLDLWAQQHGYSKLQINLMML